MNKNIIHAFTFTWGSLGFYRGIAYYDYNHKKNVKEYENSKRYNLHNRVKPQDSYVSKFGVGILSTAMYLSPIGVLTAIKELYRLEINLRGLEEKKEEANYYFLLPWI